VSFFLKKTNQFQLTNPYVNLSLINSHNCEFSHVKNCQVTCNKLSTHFRDLWYTWRKTDECLQSYAITGCNKTGLGA